MVKNYSAKLSGQIGENLVVAELGRRGIVATAFAGNVPEIDLLAYKDGKSIPIQIKSLKSGSVRTKANSYLKIAFDGQIQKILGRRKDINRDLIFVIIKIGQQLGDDIFYVCKQGTIQDLVFREHCAFLEKNGGIRPRNPSSYDCSVHLENLEDFKGKWELIDEALSAKQHTPSSSLPNNGRVD